MNDASGTIGTLDLTDGVPLERTQRFAMEARFAADLSRVRIHRGRSASHAAARLGADAFTVGSDIHFASGRYRPDTARGTWLLAHEIAHVLQQTSRQVPGHDGAGGPFIGRRGDPWERAACCAADLATAGHPVRGAWSVSRTAGPDRASAPAVQPHDSFEHRVLGDVSTAELTKVATGAGERTQILEREIALLWLWHQSPESVTEEQIRQQCPAIKTVRLQESDLLVTYGELNALPDYIATGGVADTISKDVLLPILQYIRQEGYIQLNKLLNRGVTTPFAHSVFSPSQWLPGMVNRLLESLAIDDLTSQLGKRGTDHYTALLGRNACHFAPYAWHRWQASYQVAVDLARRAHASSDSNERARLTHQAWVQHGYADHFLQDAFAAGHLVNKTLIMQWFIDWAAGQSLVPVFDWDSVKNMTPSHQPGLAGRSLYNPAYTGLSNDPQTAEDQATYADRLRTTGVAVGASGTLDNAYQEYLTFLSSLITQSASCSIHDYYNTNSLWVASVAQPTPYEVYGDDTLLSGTNGGGGVQATSESAQLSQQSLQEVLDTGTSSISMRSLQDRFPTKVKVGDALLGLESWNDTQRDFCGKQIFPELHDLVLRISTPQIVNTSQDQDLTPRWSTSLADARYTTTSVLQLGHVLLVGSNGYLFELDLASGKVLSQLRLTDAAGAGNYETRLATDGTTVFVGVHGYVYAVRPGGALQKVWEASLPKAGWTVVDVICAQGALVAGSNGYVYKLDPATGKVTASLLLGSMFGSGDYTMRLALNGSALVAGTHGYVYSVSLATFSQDWECSLDGAGYHLVDVAVGNGQIFAGSNGYIFQIDGRAGRSMRSLRVTDSVGVGDYTTTVALGDGYLFVGSHGYVYGVRRNDWSRSAWSANLAGNRYSMVNLAVNGNQLVAGSYGYVFRIDPTTGQVVRAALITSVTGVGEYETRLSFDQAGDNLYTGVHGYAYDLGSVH